MRQTTLCYLRKEDTLLMLHRIKKINDINADKWIGVGGKVEKNETIEQCLQREVREETGYVLMDWKYHGVVEFHSDTWGSEMMHLYSSFHFTGTQCDCDEGVLSWISIDRLNSVNLWQGDKLFLDLMLENAPFFHLVLYYRGDELVKQAVHFSGDQHH